MPFFVQLVKDLTTKVETVQKKTEDREKKDEKLAQQQMSQPPIDIYQDLGFIMPGLNNLPMLMGPGMGPGMAGPGPNPMGMDMSGFSGAQGFQQGFQSTPGFQGGFQGGFR